MEENFAGKLIKNFSDPTNKFFVMNHKIGSVILHEEGKDGESS